MDENNQSTGIDPVSEPKPVSEPVAQASNPTNPVIDDWKYDPAFMKLMNHFSIESNDSEWYKDKLSVVRDWAKSRSKSDDVVDWLVEIKGLQRQLGFSLGDKSINEVYRWVRLDQDEQRIKKEKSLLNNNGV